MFSNANINPGLALCLALVLVSVSGSSVGFLADSNQGVSGVSTYLLPSSPDLTFYIEDDLFNRIDFMNELSMGCFSNIQGKSDFLSSENCSDFANSNSVEPNSIYFVLNNNNKRLFSYRLCNPGSNLLAVVEVKLLTDHAAPKPQVRDILPTLIDQLQGRNGEYCRSRAAKVMHGSACSAGSYSFSSSSCSENRQRRLTTFQESYDAALITCNQDVACAVSTLSLDTSLTVSDYDTLAQYLYNYATATSGQSNAYVVDESDYQVLSSAVVSMLTTSLTISETKWELVYSCLNAYSGISDPENFNENDNYELVLASYYYILKYSNELSEADPAFITKVSVTVTLINNYFLNFIKYNALSAGFSGIASSSENLFTGKLVYVNYSLNKGNYLSDSSYNSCSCTECAIENALAEITIKYIKFASQTTVFNLALFTVGSISDQGLFTYSNPIALDFSGQSCFSNEYELITDSGSFYGWDCIVITGTSPCNHFGAGTSITPFIRVTHAGLYEIIKGCASGKVYTSSSNTCENCNENCSCATPGTCASCIDPNNYYKDSSSQTCKYICMPANCESCSPPYHSVCTLCKSSFIPNTDNTACGCQPSQNCARCNTLSNQCSQCQTGYVLTSNQINCGCNAISNCNQCNNDLTTCSTCATGYVLNTAATICGCNTIANCQVCNDNKINCDTCKNNLVPTVNKLNCGCAGISNCQYCDNSNTATCSVCVAPYKPTQNKLLCGCNTIDNCAVCDNSDQTKCFACTAPYVLSQDKRSCGCGTIENCGVCNNNGVGCFSCSTGYIFSQDSSKCGCFGIAQCTKCSNEDSTMCAQCSSTYVLSENKKRCACQGSHDCDVCSNVDNQCLHCTVESNAIIVSTGLDCGCGSVDKCAYCNADRTTCTACTTGYTISADYHSCGCFGIDNCKTCNTVTNKCTVCAPSYALNANSNKCGCSSYVNCGVCNDAGTVCLSCKSGYIYTVDNSKCGCGDVLNCGSCTNANVCTACKPNYLFNANQNACGCFGATNCAVCDTTTQKCAQCLTTNIFTSDLKKCGCGSISNCNVCNDDLSTCKTCATNYKPSIDYTFCGCNTDQLCITCSVNNKCSVCQTGYAPDSNGVCVTGLRCYQSSYFVSFVFNKKYTKLTLTLNTAFISTGSKDCATYFTDKSSFGYKPTCNLLSKNKVLRINLGRGFTIRLGDGLLLKSSVTMASGPIQSSCSDQGVIVGAAPGIDTAVYASLSGPQSIIVTCSSAPFFLYTSTSYGIGKSSFIYEWSVNNAVQSATTQIFKFDPTGYSGQVQIKLKVTNFLSQIGTATLNVEVIVDQTVTFKINTGQKAEFKRSSSISLYITNPNYCGFNNPSTFLWSFTRLDGAFGGLTNDMTKNRLKISANTLSVGTYKATLTVTVNNNANPPTPVIGYDESLIIVIHSDLVAIMNKFDQDISSTIPLVVNGKKSYDPDGENLAYAWFINDDEQTYTSDTITIPTSVLTSFGPENKFTLTLQVSADTRTDTVSATFDVIVLSFSCSIDIKKNKFPVSSQNTLQGVLSGLSATDTASVLWSVISDSTIVLKNTRTLLLNIKANSMTEGASYQIQLTATAKISGLTQIARAVVSITANRPAECSGSTEVDPLGGTTKTVFTAYITGCYDLDAEDNPLVYYLSLYRGTISVRVLISSVNYFTNFFIPSTVHKLAITVCDQLNDCNVYDSQTFTVTKFTSRSLKNSQSILDEYKQWSYQYDNHFALHMILNEYHNLPADVIDALWEDFTMQIENERAEGTEELIEQQTMSTIWLFIQPEQNQDLARERLDKYSRFLLKHLDGYKVINAETRFLLIDYVEKVLQLDSSIANILMVDSIISKVLTIESIPGSEDFINESKTFSGFTVENFVEHLEKTPIALRTSSVSYGDFGLGPKEIVKIEAYEYATEGSDVVHFSATSDKAQDLDEFIYSDPREISWPKGNVVFTLKVEGIVNPICQRLNRDEWEEAGCEILSTDGKEAKISIESNGFYKVLNASPKTSNTSLFLALGVVLFAIPFIILCYYLDSKQTYIHVSTGSSEQDTYRSGYDGKEIQPIRFSLPIISYHLLLSIFTAKFDNPRALKILLITANVLLGLFIQSCLLRSTSWLPVVVGFTSALIAIPVSALYSILMKKAKICSAFALVIICTSLAGAYMSGNQEGCLIAFAAGVATEFIVAQSLIMVARKALSI